MPPTWKCSEGLDALAYASGYIAGGSPAESQGCRMRAWGEKLLVRAVLNAAVKPDERAAALALLGEN
jgi:hypothetical protein